MKATPKVRHQISAVQKSFLKQVDDSKAVPHIESHTHRKDFERAGQGGRAHARDMNALFTFAQRLESPDHMFTETRRSRPEFERLVKSVPVSPGMARYAMKTLGNVLLHNSEYALKLRIDSGGPSGTALAAFMRLMKHADD